MREVQHAERDSVRCAVGMHVFQPGDSMAAVIAHEFGEASSDPVHRAALIGLAVLLFVFTLLVNIVARRFASRADRMSGA